MIPLRLQVERDEAGGWRLWLVHRDTRGRRGALSAEAVAALRGALAAAAEGGPTLLVPGDDVEVSAQERSSGRALSAVLTASPEISRELGFYRGQAHDGEPLLLVVSVPDPALSALPWELLCAAADEGHLEDTGASIARLADGRPRPPRPPRTTLRNLTWAPGDDAISARVLAQLEAAARAADLPPPEPLSAAPLPGEEDAAILHLVVHGAVDHDQLALLVGTEQRQGTGGLTAQLRRWLPRVDLVVLSICESGAALPAELDGLVGQLIQAGAPAVVAPADELGVEAAGAFVAGLVASLASGAPMPAAVSAGRRSVRALALPFPDARWHSLQLTLGDLGRTAPLVRQGWRPAGWPRPGADAGAVLAQAASLASGSRFVGVEHLLLAIGMAPTAPASSHLTSVRYLIRAHQARIEKRLSLLTSDPASEAAPGGTLRLRALGARLEAGFTLGALWRVMLREQGAVLAWHLSGRVLADASADDDNTQRPETDPELDDDGRVGALEVLGGPECGRRLAFQPGARIGRWRAGAPRQSCPIVLFEQTPMRDQTLSRSGVLRWSAPDRLEALVSHLVLLRSGQPPAPAAPGEAIWLRLGDRIQLSKSCWLLACGAARP